MFNVDYNSYNFRKVRQIEDYQLEFLEPHKQLFWLMATGKDELKRSHESVIDWAMRVWTYAIHAGYESIDIDDVDKVVDLVMDVVFY